MGIATVGARFQVVIPAGERRRLGIRPGDKVVMEVVGDHLEVRVMGGCGLRGLGKELTRTTDPVAYVRELRAEWTNRE
jgi:AbrB family looped-hinge helix DNA binding protein